MKIRRILPFATLAAAVLPLAASAHEAYVLPTADFWSGMKKPFDIHAINALNNPANIAVAVKVIAGTFIGLGLNFAFRRTRFGAACHAYLERFAFLGPIFVRGTIAGALFLGAIGGSFLGPELPMSGMPFASVLRWTVIVSSLCIAAGFFTEIAATAALAAFALGFASFGPYLFTYFNYLGELVALILFGTRRWSIDRQLFGPLKRLVRWEKYGTVIVRVCYGFALIYAGITVKFLHPDLTVEVINRWNLTQFHWLFPSDPLLVTFGAGLAEAAIGLFIMFGFEVRLTVLISLFYITLSLLFFRELVWPHLLLYGISLNLLVEPETFTLDDVFFRKKGETTPPRTKLTA